MAAFYRGREYKELVERLERNNLGTVDEFGQGDVGVVVEDVDILEMGIGSVLELDAKEVTDIRRRAAAKLDSDSRRVLSYIPE